MNPDESNTRPVVDPAPVSHPDAPRPDPTPADETKAKDERTLADFFHQSPPEAAAPDTAAADKQQAKDERTATRAEARAEEKAATAQAIQNDERIPVNERAVAVAAKQATMKCPFCGTAMLKAAVPGSETPEEYCPGCGRGAAVEAV